MTGAIRTPDVLLDGPPGFDWAPSFRLWDGLRLAHVDVGSGPPVLIADFVDRVDELPVGRLVRRGCAVDPRDEVAAAYDAPFPSEAGKAGARAFPGLIPLAPDDPGASVGRDVLAALRSDSRPVLLQEDRGGEIGGLIADWLP